MPIPGEILVKKGKARVTRPIQGMTILDISRYATQTRAHKLAIFRR